MPTPLSIAVVPLALTADVRQAPRLAREGGFTGLLFDAYSALLDAPALSTSGRREFRHLLSVDQQALVGLRLDAGPSGFSPSADIDRMLARCTRAMEAAADLASPLLCIDLGPLPEPPNAAPPKPKVAPQQAGLLILPESITQPAPAPTPEPRPIDPAFVASVDGALAELGRAADRYSVVCAFRSDLASFAAIDRALRAVNCPWFGIDLDPVAVMRDDWSLDQVLSRLGATIRHVRARDATKGADRRTRPAPIGKGSTNWQELREALDAASYQGWITIDPLELPDRQSAALTALHYLNKGLAS